MTRPVVSKSTTDNPRELAVNPIKRYLYWIDYGQFPMIARSWLDGSHRKSIVTERISNPTDISIDIATHDVYWVDTQQVTIEECIQIWLMSPQTKWGTRKDPVFYWSS